jgi:tripartite-type tricarboxylate transporter receptor subunit TctC
VRRKRKRGPRPPFSKPEMTVTVRASKEGSLVRLLTQVLLFIVLVPCNVDAQVRTYPVKAIRAIVPYAPGSPVEIPARLIAPRLTEALGQSFVIENRVGAGARMGTALVAKAAPDGYTLLFNNNSHSANVSQYKKLPYDSIVDFAPITLVNFTSGSIVAVSPSLPVRSIKELVALAGREQLRYATAGIGSPQHIAGALFAAMAGIELVHVPYKGTIAGLTDVVGGRTEIMFVSPGVSLPFVKEGRVRAIAVTGARRLTALPDVPTVKEVGIADYEVISWHGIWFPAAVPVDIVQRMRDEVAKLLAAPEMRKLFDDNFLVPVGISPKEFADFVREDIAMQGAIAKKIGLEPEL